MEGCGRDANETEDLVRIQKEICLPIPTQEAAARFGIIEKKWREKLGHPNPADLCPHQGYSRNSVPHSRHFISISQ
jgi:hypothetical protein